MKIILQSISVVIMAALASLLAVANGVFFWTASPMAPRGDAAAFAAAVSAKLDAELHGNGVFLMLENGTVIADHIVEKDVAIDSQTRFQLASLSKWIAAFGVLTLVEEGAVDLDLPVSTYLTRWSLPDSEFDNDGVTVRRLLSHMAGLDDGLGYAGFAPGEPLQSLEESLTQAADRDPSDDGGAVRVAMEPGTNFNYSGGGYTLLQLLVEEVSGQSFDAYMKRSVFQPLGMSDTTFIIEDGEADLAAFYDENGDAAPHRRYTALAAASLYSSAADIACFLRANAPGKDGAPAGRGVLSPDTLRMMREPHGSVPWLGSLAQYGLGLMLYVSTASGDFVIGHDGNNGPAINTTARVDPVTGDGVIVLVSGHSSLATEIGGEWVFWATGKADLLHILGRAGAILAQAMIAAVLAFLATSAFWIVRGRRKEGVAK